MLLSLIVLSPKVIHAESKNIYLLVDRSYSMIRENSAGDVPLRTAVGIADELNGALKRETGADFRLHTGFFGGLAEGIVDSAEIDRDLLFDRLEAGRSPIGGVIREQLSSISGGGVNYIILFSDGVDTGGSLPESEYFIEQRTALVFAAFPHPTGLGKEVTEELKNTAVQTGGKTVEVTSVKSAVSEITEFLSLPYTHPKKAARKTADEKPKVCITRNEEQRSESAPSSYPFGITTLFLFVGSAGITTRSFQKERERTKRIYKTEPRPVIYLDTESPDKGMEHFSFKHQPVLVSSGSYGDLLLPFADAEGSFTIGIENGKPLYRSEQTLNVNGVAKRKKELKTGDRIALGRYRIFYRKVEYEKEESKTEQRTYASIGATASLLIISAIFILFPLRNVSTAEPIPSQRTVQKEKTLPTLSDNPTEKKENNLRTVSASFLSPGDQVDVLFIHAHPDDETIDYGGTIAAYAYENRKVGVLLFTDGESGADLYPYRHRDGIYSDELLTGKALAEVRVQEAQESLKVLGADLYIRFGLRNNPYYGLEDVLTRDDVIEAWGGEKNILRVMKKAVRVMKPELIIGPYPDPDAHEHFEHKTVGYLCRKAMKELKEEGVPFTYRQFIEPWLMEGEDAQEIYPGRKIIRVDIGDEFRDIQRRALIKYETQRDASVIAAETLWTYEAEWYEEISLD